MVQFLKTILSPLWSVFKMRIIMGESNYFELLELNNLDPQPSHVLRQWETLREFYQSPEFLKKSGFTPTEIADLLTLLDEARDTLCDPQKREAYIEAHRSQLENWLDLQRKTQNTIFKPSMKWDYEKDPEMETWILQLKSWNGEALRKVRNYKRVSLQQLSEVTKINPFYLNAIEEMEPFNLPASVYVRGYIKEYARALQLPWDIVVSSYMRDFEDLKQKYRRSSVS